MEIATLVAIDEGLAAFVLDAERVAEAVEEPVEEPVETLVEVGEDGEDEKLPSEGTMGQVRL